MAALTCIHARERTYLTGCAYLQMTRALLPDRLAVAEDGPNAVRVATASPDPILLLRLSSPNAVILASSANADGAPSVIGTGNRPMRLTATEGVQRAVL